jgi:hypothetical protein
VVSARLPVHEADELDLGTVDPARRFLPVRDFAALVSLSESTCWRLIAARDPRLEIVRFAAGRRAIVRVRLRSQERSAADTC